jgi:hypothetical protein
MVGAYQVVGDVADLLKVPLEGELVSIEVSSRKML